MATANSTAAFWSRIVAILGGLIVLGGIGALVLLGVVLASESGAEIPVYLTLPENAKALLLYGGGAAFLAGAVLNVVGNFLAGAFEPVRSGSPAAEGTDGPPTIPRSERYRRKLARSYGALATIVFGLVAIDVVGRAMTGPQTSSVVDVVLLYINLGIRLLFGSSVGALVFALLLGGLWYGVHARSAEALLAGLVVAILFFPAAAATGSLGFAIAGIWLLFYTVMARSATEFKVAETNAVPPAIRQLLGK